MSEFDKEAEREKLREKYGEDDQEREATQRMSQLLLQGATMTNRHCDNCGDPIFRQNGQEFCPTCQGEAAGETGDAAADVDAQTDAGAATGDADAGSTDTAADVETEATETAPDVEADATASVRAADTAGSDPAPNGVDASGAPSDAADRRRARETTTDARPTGRPSQSRPVGAADGLEEAEGALTAALTRFARAASETDDPRRAKDHLAAAREAAEALAALRK